MSNCIPCSPCNKKCPDDKVYAIETWVEPVEILETTILDPEECWGCWGCWSCWWCKDNCGINIQSTNDCLTVDTSECWVIKLTAECPRPTYIKAGTNVTVRDITPPSDCYIDWGECWTEGWWEVSSTDEKVKACSWDTRPGYLIDKLEEGYWIIISPVGCDDEESTVEIAIDPDQLPKCPPIPDVKVENSSKLIKTSTNWHTIYISDRENTFYDNNVCIGFTNSQFYSWHLDHQWNADTVQMVREWNICTWNKELATTWGIQIQESWYYRVFWQLTVQNNTGQSEESEINNRYINLWRWVLDIQWKRTVFKPSASWRKYYLGTAKHWEYIFAMQLRWGRWIKVNNDGEISISWWSVDVDDGWTVPVAFGESSSQALEGRKWPWMTFNIDCYVDLYKWDLINLGYRAQTDMPEGVNKDIWFKFAWVDDSSSQTESANYNALFGWSCLWVQMIAPKVFQANWVFQVYDNITNAPIPPENFD